MRTILLVFILVAFGCKLNENGSRGANSEEFDCTFNSNRTYQLCIGKQVDPKTKLRLITYFISDENGQNITEGTLMGGYVKWFDDNAIEIFQPPGNISDQVDKDDLIDIYVIDSKVRLSKKEYLIQK